MSPSLATQEIERRLPVPRYNQRSGLPRRSNTHPETTTQIFVNVNIHPPNHNKALPVPPVPARSIPQIRGQDVARDYLQKHALGSSTERYLSRIGALGEQQRSLTNGNNATIQVFSVSEEKERAAFFRQLLEQTKQPLSGLPRLAPVSQGKPAAKRSWELATRAQLDGLVNAHPLSVIDEKAIRYRFWYDWLTTYRCLFIIVSLVNISLIGRAINLMVKYPGALTPAAAANAVATNLCIATLMRHEHCINLIFKVCTSPFMRAMPLWIRCHAAKVYCYGGIHSGCGVSALLWYIVFAVSLIQSLNTITATAAEAQALLATTVLLLVLFLFIICLAHPTFRNRYHNQWEWSHRYAGWTAVAVVWIQIGLLCMLAAKESSQSTSYVFVAMPAFWLILIITLLFIYPWLRLRRHRVRVEKLSDHAVRLWFGKKAAPLRPLLLCPDRKREGFQRLRDGEVLPTCVGTRLATNPLAENHGFATIPNPAGQPGFSVVVSNAGDWTKGMITNPPKHLWTRGAFTAGVLRVSLLFKPIIIVATGSGIGPCLSFLQVHPDWPCRVLWSARNPESTYGSGVMSAVFRADPRAVVIDPKSLGTKEKPYRADMAALAYGLYREIGAEAVCIISNPTATQDLVGRLERRGIPAYGAIFDS